MANGVSQKNHFALLDAWEIINKNYKLPLTLHLTIPENFPHIIRRITELKTDNVSVINHGFCTVQKLESLYKKCKFFVNPSLAESFGLPIIEAAEAGCEIISADLPYIYDIVNPLATFDPQNKLDIAKTVIAAYNDDFQNKTTLKVSDDIEKLINLLINNV